MNNTEINIPNTDDLWDAADAAYAEVAERNNIDVREAHTLSLCYDVTGAMLRGLGARGYTSPDHEIRNAPGVPEHSYVVMPIGNDEYVADPTWQQFLSRDKRHPGLPRVLMGGRERVAQQAAAYGVPSEWLGLWRGQGRGMTVAEQRARDKTATRLADEAEAAGKWDAFMRGPEPAAAMGGRSLFSRTQKGRHRKVV